MIAIILSATSEFLQERAKARVKKDYTTNAYRNL